MRSDDRYLDDIAHSVVLINEYLKGVARTLFIEDLEDMQMQKTRDAVVRRLEIIGEAATHLSGEWKTAHSLVPWSEVIATRNVLIHEYFGVDYEIVWQVVLEHLPILEKELVR